MIDGEVHAAGAFSRVAITMRPSIFVLVFAAFFSFSFVSVFFGIEDGAFWPALAAPVLLYAMMLFGFWLEANKIEQTLRRILKAT